MGPTHTPGGLTLIWNVPSFVVVFVVDTGCGLANRTLVAACSYAAQRIGLPTRPTSLAALDRVRWRFACPFRSLFASISCAALLLQVFAQVIGG